MDSMRTQPAANRVYVDFEPPYEWVKNERLFTVFLPGYRRDQLKVQVTSKPGLRLMGERLITANRWHRFNLEFPIPSDYDADDVIAKFEDGKLLVRFGQLTKPRETLEEAPRPKEPSPKVDQQKGAQEDTPKAETRTNGEVSEQKTPQKVVEQVNETEKGKTETTDSTGKAAQEARTNGLTETEAAATSKAPKTKAVTRSKTRLIGFSPSFRPSNKWKKLVKWVVLILLVVGLGIYARNTFRLSHGESNFQEL
ncbi:uncharacterized protein LOC113874525 [Abrus precatorius]|uniref:Uncharacterized protein LOC113874525 n=1 Tax=Abrus precatorius TaxID=3816 RepID=A0A8B8MKW5_ABRPR|nr:uncharacterized protein LOC113874525 [Abrus precatorius]